MTRVFDCHDEAYFDWRDAGVNAATLVHVDAHHDIEAASPSGLIHVGNYVRAAIRDGIVARVAWVVPDPMWHDPAERVRLFDAIRNAAVAAPVEAVPLPDLAAFTTPVLLDIDLDYFFTTASVPDLGAGELREPWTDPAAVVDALLACCPVRTMTTVATSVTGSFAPLGWKAAADEIAARIDRRPLDGRIVRAGQDFRRAEAELAAGRIAEARSAFARALAVDAGYRHPFRTLGHHRLIDGRRSEAAALFESALVLDERDHWARLGLAMIALDEGRPRDASAQLDGVPADGDSIDAARARARAFAALGDVDAAIAAYTGTLKLALHGAVPLAVWTSNRDRRLADPRHWSDHLAIAELYGRRGDARSEKAHRLIAGAAAPRSATGTMV